MDIRNILENELKGSVDFFLDFTNLTPDNPGYGLTADSTKKPQVASIASTGFALTAWVIAAERGYLNRQRALGITRGTLHTLLDHASHYHGFFAHFLDIETGERIKRCEYSTIDTSLCLNGVITAAAYFKDGEINKLSRQLLDRVDWNFIVFKEDGKTLFQMAYNPDQKGDYVHNNPGFIHRWDMAAEQKMMYLQTAAYVKPEVARALYHGFSRDIGMYEGCKIIVNPGGSLFAYQFSEAWLDAARYLDPDGVDWFENTRLAALANRSYCIEHSKKFKTYHEKSWGASAGDSPWGYDVSGATPCLDTPKPNGTVSIYGALSCLPYIPELTLEMVEYLYREHPKTWGNYGFYDAYNTSVNPPWYSHTLYGIDKGCSMIMIENYLDGLVWNTYTNSPIIQNALNILGFKKR
jgi:hypothetical protein